MTVNSMDLIDDFFADHTRRGFDFDETIGALKTIAELCLVEDFLRAHNAPPAYLQTLEDAKNDAYGWVERGKQEDVLRKVPSAGSTPGHHALRAPRSSSAPRGRSR